MSEPKAKVSLAEKNAIFPASIRYGEDGSAFDFTRRNINQKSVVYYCKHERKCKCKAKLLLDRDKRTGIVDETTKKIDGQHTRACCVINRVDVDEYDWKGKVAFDEDLVEEEEGEENDDPNPSPSKARKMKRAVAAAAVDERAKIVNVYEEAIREVDDLATSNLTLAPAKVWEELQKKLDEKYPEGWCGVKKDSMVNRVRRTRLAIGMGDHLRTVETSSYGRMTDTERSFLQNHQAVPNPDKPGELQRIMVFGNPSLFGLLMAANVDLYLDATFTVPPGFYQLLICMVYDRTRSAYVPVVYTLMTHKTQVLYWHALASIVVLSNWKLAARSFTTDFEKALINAAKTQFPEGFHVGCLFHLKQAWRRHLIVKLGFLAAQIKLAMEVGTLDLLCIIPQDEVEEFGIPYVRSVIEEDLDEDEVAKWDEFWVYFKHQWIPILDSWNISDENGEYKNIMNRTNNGLESYNKQINALFTHTPSLLEFCAVMEQESRRVARRLQDIDSGTVDRPTYNDVTIPKIPRAYHKWVKDNS